MTAREWVRSVQAKMKIGDEVKIEGRTVREAFPSGFPTIYETTEQAFLSCQVGAAWGTWKIAADFHNDFYTISRHKEGDKRVYVDPDHAHLYRRMPDGSYAWRDNLSGARAVPSPSADTSR